MVSIKVIPPVLGTSATMFCDNLFSTERLRAKLKSPAQPSATQTLPLAKSSIWPPELNFLISGRTFLSISNATL